MRINKFLPKVLKDLQCLIIGDLHIGLPFSSLDRDEEIEDIIYNTINDSVKLYNINYCVLLGDIFHYSNSTPKQTAFFIRILKYFEEHNIFLFVLLGNHDKHRKANDLHALLPFKELEDVFNNFNIIDKPTLEVFNIDNIATIKFALIPFGYNTNNTDLQIDSDTVIFSHSDNIFKKDPWWNNKEYMYNFNGHIHSPSIQNNHINIGSIIKTTMEEKFDIKNCYIFRSVKDKKQINYQLIPLQTHDKPLYDIIINLVEHYVSINNEEKDLNYFNIDKMIQQDCLMDIKIVVNNVNDINIEIKQILDKLQTKGFIRNKNIFPLKKNIKLKQMKQVKSSKKMVINFIDNYCNSKKKDRIKEIALEIMN